MDEDARSDIGLGDGAMSEATPLTPQKQSRTPLLITIGVLVVALIAAGLWWHSFTRTPRYSLGQLTNAVQKKDWDGVQKYVDVDAVVEQLMDVAMGQVLEEDDSGFGALAAGLMESMKPVLAQQVRKALQESVEEGVDSESESASLVGALTANTVKKTTYIGDEALVTVKSEDASGESLELRLRMRRVEDFWRITGIENIEDFLPSGITQ